MTGWGQDGPIAHTAGHDINYIALSGALYSIGDAGGPPVPPLNLIGDFGGGALYLGDGRPGRHHQRTRQRQGTGHRLLDGRGLGLADDDDVRRAGRRRLEGGARYEPHRRRRALITTSTRPRTASTSRSARSSRNSMRCCWRHRSRRRAPARADRPYQLARHAASVWRASSRKRRAPNGPRSWSRPTSVSRRCCACPRRSTTRITSIAQSFVEVDGHQAAGAGAALSRHPDPGARPAGPGRRTHRRDPQGLGFLGRRDRRPAPGRGGGERGLGRRRLRCSSPSGYRCG